MQIACGTLRIAGPEKGRLPIHRLPHDGLHFPEVLRLEATPDEEVFGVICSGDAKWKVDFRSSYPEVVVDVLMPYDRWDMEYVSE